MADAFLFGYTLFALLFMGVAVAFLGYCLARCAARWLR